MYFDPDGGERIHPSQISISLRRLDPARAAPPVVIDPTAVDDKLKVNCSLNSANSTAATTIGMSVPGSTGSGHVTVSTLAGTASARMQRAPISSLGWRACADEVKVFGGK